MITVKKLSKKPARLRLPERTGPWSVKDQLSAKMNISIVKYCANIAKIIANFNGSRFNSKRETMPNPKVMSEYTSDVHKGPGDLPTLLSTRSFKKWHSESFLSPSA